MQSVGGGLAMRDHLKFFCRIAEFPLRIRLREAQSPVDIRAQRGLMQCVTVGTVSNLVCRRTAYSIDTLVLR